MVSSLVMLVVIFPWLRFSTQAPSHSQRQQAFPRCNLGGAAPQMYFSRLRCRCSGAHLMRFGIVRRRRLCQSSYARQECTQGGQQGCRQLHHCVRFQRCQIFFPAGTGSPFVRSQKNILAKWKRARWQRGSWISWISSTSSSLRSMTSSAALPALPPLGRREPSSTGCPRESSTHPIAWRERLLAPWQNHLVARVRGKSWYTWCGLCVKNVPRRTVWHFLDPVLKHFAAAQPLAWRLEARVSHRRADRVISPLCPTAGSLRQRFGRRIPDS